MKEQLAIYPNRLTLLGAILFPPLFLVASIVVPVLFWEDLTLFPLLVFGAVFLFFGFVFVTSCSSLIRNFTNPQPQLLLDSTGVTFCDNKRTPYLLVWVHIFGFQQITIARQEYIIVCVKNPATLIDKEQNAKHRRLMLHNQNHYGSPFIIAPTLNIPTRELLSTLREYHQKYAPHRSA